MGEAHVHRKHFEMGTNADATFHTNKGVQPLLIGDAVRPTVGLLKHTRPLPTMQAHVAQDGDEVDSGCVVMVEHKGP